MVRPSPQTERVVELMKLLGAKGKESLSLAEVSRSLAVNKSTCYSMLTALTDAGWLMRDPKRKTYRVGPTLVEIGRNAAIASPALDFAQGPMRRLSLELGLNCVVLTLGSDFYMVADEAHDLRAGRGTFFLGVPIPKVPPYGMFWVPWAEEQERSHWYESVPTAVRSSFERAAEATRGRGFSVELHATPEERLSATLEADGITREGDRIAAIIAGLAPMLRARSDFILTEWTDDEKYSVSNIAAPVFDGGGHVTLALAVAGFQSTISGHAIDVIGGRLRDETDRLTAALRGETPSWT